MADNEKSFLVVLKGKADDFKKGMSEAGDSAQKFSFQLAAAAATSKAAFESIKFAVVESVTKFAEADRSNNQMIQSLQQQGIFSDQLAEKYNKLAQNLSNLTGEEKDSLKASFAQAQGMLGQVEITEGLTKAVADLAVAKGISLNEAFEKVTKTIGSDTNALKKLGISIDETADKQTKLNQVVSKIEGAFGGQAEASQGPLVAFKQLKNAADEFQQSLGQKLAPVLTQIVKSLTSFFNTIAEQDEIVSLIANVLKVVAPIVALSTAVVASVAGFRLLTSALGPLITVIQALFTLMTANPIGAAIALIIGALILLYKYWNEIIPAIRGIFAAFVDNIGTLAFGLKEILMGALTLDPERIKAGLEKVNQAIKEGVQDFKKTFNEVGSKDAFKFDIDTKPVEESQNKQKQILKDAADERERLAKEHADRLKLIKKLESENLLQETEGGSKQLIELRKQEISILQKLDDEKYKSDTETLKTALEQNRQAQVEANQIDVEQRAAFEQAKLDQKDIYNQLTAEQQDAFDREYLDKNQASYLTEYNARQAVLDDKLKLERDRNNQFLKDQVQYGTAYATLNKTMHSQEVEGFKSATSELVALTQSKNSTLKEIGKAASVAQITIDSARGAMAAYAGFATIPIIGPALGIAAAAAIIAFGAERISDVVGANDGGLITGGVAGKDSVPAMLTPGELVVPAKNFDQVVGAVRGENQGADLLPVLESISSKLSQPSQTIINGDIMTDTVFVDRLIQKINERLEFGNARLLGVT